jgi:hypothetical protein
LSFFLDLEGVVVVGPDTGGIVEGANVCVSFAGSLLPPDATATISVRKRRAPPRAMSRRRL